MTTLFIFTVLILFGLFFLFTGVMSFVRPTLFAKSLALLPVGRSGEVEIRAQYGGFFFVAGIVQFLPFAGFMTFAMAFTLSLIIFGGLILGRVGSMLFDAKGQALVSTIHILFLIDGVGTLLAATGLYFSSSTGYV